MNISRQEMTTAAAVFAAAMAVVYLIGPRDFMTGDTTHYAAMVRGEAAPAPFAFRVLTPTLVQWLPGSLGQGFFTVAYSATLATLLTMYLLFRHLGVSHTSAMVTGVFLCLSYPLANYLARWGRIDPLANFLFALALLLILKRHFLPATVVMAFGVLGKETLVLLLPILFVHRLAGERLGVRSVLTTAALCALPLLSFVAIRATIEPKPGSYTVESAQDLDEVLQEVWAYNVDQFGLPKRIARDLTKSYGFFWALAGLGVLTIRQLRFESLYMIAIGFLLCIVATDWARMLGTGFPGIFIPVALFIDRPRHHPIWWRWTVALLILSLAQCYLSLLIYRDLSAAGQVAMLGTQLLVVVVGVGLAMWGVLRREPRVELA
ncbi:MAG: glycosyltransferase 87 family protein [Acidobacteriota bacterium]